MLRPLNTLTLVAVAAALAGCGPSSCSESEVGAAPAAPPPPPAPAFAPLVKVEPVSAHPPLQSLSSVPHPPHVPPGVFLHRVQPENESSQ